jgi:anti-sigma-K factor RskA
MSTDLHTLSGAYAINALSPQEAEAFREHLAACSACRDEVRELQEAAAMMGASEAMSAPAHLKARVMQAADRTPQQPPKVSDIGTAPTKRRAPKFLLAAAAVALIVAAGFGITQVQQPPDSVLAAPVAQVFEAPDAHQATMETSNGGTISVATSPSLGKMAVDTDELPDLEGGQTYQLWAISDGTPQSAGLLEDPDAGAAMDMPAQGIEVAITIEPSGGSELPTTDPIMSVVPSEV